MRDHARDRRGLPQRRRAAAEIDRDQVTGVRTGPPVEFLDDRIGIALVRRLDSDLDGEVAVRAQLAAPREMKVDA